MTKQTTTAMQGLKWLSIGLMLLGALQILVNHLAKINSTDQLSVAMILIGIVGLNISLLLESLFRRVDALEKKINEKCEQSGAGSPPQGVGSPDP